MDNLSKSGRIMFASGTLTLGIFCIIYKDFIIGRPPAWPASFTPNPALADISGVVLIIAAIAILLKKKAGSAALLIATLILLLSVSRHLPQFMTDWVNAYKAMALFGGALIASASFFREDNSITPRVKVNENERKNILIAGTLLLAVFFIACGYAHFKWARGIQFFIPDYMPFRLFWTYFCGVCLIAGGAGLLIPSTKRLAALLSGIMFLGWFFLLHIPRFLADTTNYSDRLGLCESFIFSGICFMLAGQVSLPKAKF